MTIQDITNQLQHVFPKALLKCTGTLYHLEIHMIDPQFQDLSTLKRHQIVYRALKEKFQNQTLHAVTLKLYSPQELSDFSSL